MTAVPYQFEVRVVTRYLDDQSNPPRDLHAWAYTITVRNTGTMAAQLISRHWVITAANDQVQEVRGLGVVGYQPLLQPGESFEYTSGTTLPTPSGTMRGEYFCTAEDGTQFEVPIVPFVLVIPRILH
ncbi:Co2+/Mg2+ efflux protein ApaG [soil metagenome]